MVTRVEVIVKIHDDIGDRFYEESWSTHNNEVNNEVAKYHGGQLREVIKNWINEQEEV